MRILATNIRAYLAFVLVCMGVSLSLSAQVIAKEPVQKVYLFILSGQSNMVALEPKKTFIPTLNKAFPNDEILVTKFAEIGQPIRRWIKRSASTKNDTPERRGDGEFYEILMEKVKGIVNTKRIDAITLIWMQGERDARTRQGGDYETNLRYLIDGFRADLQRKDMNFVIGRLSDFRMRSKEDQWEQIRRAQMLVADSDSRGAWVDTDDLNGVKNDLHYTKEGYKELGKRFAQAAIRLISAEIVDNKNKRY